MSTVGAVLPMPGLLTGGPKDWDKYFWSSYHDGFLPILQRTHGMWIIRNGLRKMGSLLSPMETHYS